MLLSKLQLRIFDGSRQLFSARHISHKITGGNQTQLIRNYYRHNDITFDPPFYDNLGDNYTVVVYANGYQQAGYSPVALSETLLKILDIMLIPKDPGFNFAKASWDVTKFTYPFLSNGVDDATGATRYGDFTRYSREGPGMSSESRRSHESSGRWMTAHNGQGALGEART